MATTPPPHVPPDRVPPDVPPRPFFYPWALTGCLFWIFVFLILYVLIGLLFAPAWTWYPWYWR